MNHTHEQRLLSYRRFKLLIGLIALALLGLGAWAVEQAIAGGSAAPVEQASPFTRPFPCSTPTTKMSSPAARLSR